MGDWAEAETALKKQIDSGLPVPCLLAWDSITFCLTDTRRILMILLTGTR